MRSLLAGLMRMSALRQAAAISFVFLVVSGGAGLWISYFLPTQLEKEVRANLSELSAKVMDGLNRASDLENEINALNMGWMEIEIVGFRTSTGAVYGPLDQGVFDEVGFSELDNGKVSASYWVFDVDMGVELDGEIELPETELLDGSIFESQKRWQDQFSFQAEEEIGWTILVSETPSGRLAIAAPNFALGGLSSVLPGALFASGVGLSSVTLLVSLIFGLIAQKRINRMSAGLNQIATGDLSVRVAPDNLRDDLDELAANIDRTTSRLSVLVDQLNHLSMNIAHDLRTPLTRLRAILEMAHVRSDDKDATIEDAIREADRIIEMFTTLMRIARLNAGDGARDFEEIDLVEFAETISETYGAVIEDTGQIFKAEIDRPAQVFGDRGMLQQAVANLIKNAITHAGKGACVTLYVTCDRIGVRDTGVGVPEPQTKKITEPLFQLDPARKSGGAGLGLALVQAICDLHSAELIIGENAIDNRGGLDVHILFHAAATEASRRKTY